MSTAKTKKQSSLSIKSWAEDDRPREKMMSKGRVVMSDAELIAILIGSGTAEDSAVGLAKRILGSVGNDLNKLGQMSFKDLMKFRGIGEAKAISIASALELGRRRNGAKPSKTSRITSSSDAFDVLYPYLSDLDHEEFYVVLLNRALRVVEVVRISQGGITGTIADARLIFKHCIDRLASHVVLAHNHPSGNLKPSKADISLTKSLVEGSKLLEIKIIDHIVIAGKGYFSFADEGLI